MFDKAKEKIEKKDAMIDGLKRLQEDLHNLGPVPRSVKEVKVDVNGKARTTYVPQDKSIVHNYLIKLINVIVQFQESEVFKSDLFPNNTLISKLGEVIDHYIGQPLDGAGKDAIVRSNYFCMIVGEKGKLISKEDIYIHEASKYIGEGNASYRGSWVTYPELIDSICNFMEDFSNKINPLLNQILQQQKTANPTIKEQIVRKIGGKGHSE